MEFKSSVVQLNCCFDHDKMEKIISNLISNAIKFTSEKNKIAIEINPQPITSSKAGRSPIQVEVRIRDTGSGISAEEVGHIFNRFYQAESSAKGRYEGTGIGLALTKELVELHGGKIAVKSMPGSGTEFIVNLELKAENSNGLKPKTQSTNSVEISKKVNGSFSIKPNSVEPDLKVSENGNEHPIILIVEDNSDVREYIRQHLEKNYHIIEAKDGKDGVKKAHDTIPDLVVCDIMMPEMNGNELCKSLKQNEKTAHIPIVLLTASCELQLHSARFKF